MRHDDQIKVALSLKKDMVLNSGWEIKCDSEEIRDHLDGCLKTGMEDSLDVYLRDMLSAYDYGFSLTEPVHQIYESLYKITALKTRPPHTFRFEMDAFGSITEVVQHCEKTEKRFKKDLFVHHVYQPEFGNPYGRSDLRAAHPAWKAKKFIFRMMAVYLERFANPTIIGKYDKNMASDEVGRFHAMLKTIQSSTVITVPEEAMIDLLQTNKDSSDSYIKAMNLCNMIIARSILVPDLMGIGGAETSGGSYSLGKTQFKLFLATIEKDRKALARLLTLRLIKPLVQANFGMEAEAEFEFRTFSEDDEVEFLRIWTDAVKGKIFEPNPEEINHLRAALRFPQGEVLLPEEPETDQQPGAPGDKEDASPEAKEGQQEKGKEQKKEKGSERTKQSDFRLRRALSAYEHKVDFAQAAKILEDQENSVVPRLLSVGRSIYRDFITQIKDKGLVSKFKPERINDLQPRFQRDMNVEVKRYFRELFRESYDEVRKELVSEKLSKTFSAEDPFLPEEFMRFLEAESFKIVGDYTTEVTKRMKNTLMRGIRDGVSEGEIVSLIRDEAEEISERWIGTLVRTKSTEIYNQARKSYWESDPIAKEIVAAYQFSAILDERTSEVCEQLDGKIFERGDYADRIVPPLHFNCRSLLVPITKFEKYEANEPIDIEKLKEIGGGLILG